MELQTLWRPSDAFSISANYTYDEARDVTDRKPLARRPKNAANVAVSYVWPVKLSTTLALRYSGRAHDSGYDAGFNTIPILLKAYSVVDIRVAYPLSERLEVFGRVENLLNQHYETAYPYGAPGRGGFIGVRSRF